MSYDELVEVVGAGLRVGTEDALECALEAVEDYEREHGPATPETARLRDNIERELGYFHARS